MWAKMSPALFLVPASWVLFFLASVSLTSCGGGGGEGETGTTSQDLDNIGYVTFVRNHDL